MIAQHHRVVLTHPRSSSAVALLVSGHLRRQCTTRPAELHLAACKARFTRCDVYLHSWRTLEPATPHWRRGWRRTADANVSSAACWNATLKRLQPVASRMEAQAAPPADSTPAPDGRPFPNSSFSLKELFWGAARHHGWRMNIHGMATVARLRRADHERSSDHRIIIRLRPDDIWRFGNTEKVAALWDCLVLLVNVSAPPSPTPNSSHDHARKPMNVRESGGRSWKRALSGSAINSCDGTPMSNVASDNCFFGQVDEVTLAGFTPLQAL